MDKELRYLLEQGPTTVKELARLSGKSTSTLYKVLKADGIDVVESPEGKRYSMRPETPQETTEPAPSTLSLTGDATVSPAPIDGPAKRGRKTTAAGQRLTAASSDNPRRKASHGYHSLQIIIDNPGITTEEYLAKGGRSNDLRWDLAHGNVISEG